MNFVQLYDYLSTRKYRHIVLKGTHYKKLKSYQFFIEGNVKKLESKVFENKTYVKANVLPSMKKTPYRAILEFSPTYDVLSAALFNLPQTMDRSIHRKYPLLTIMTLQRTGLKVL